MIVDTSAIVATIANEPDCQHFRNAILAAESLVMLSITVLETRIVLASRYGEEAVAEFDEIVEKFSIIVVPFDEELTRVAFDGFRRYGKGQGHPAQLNIVDCATYALAKTRDDTLLFKGGDFAKTDIVPAL
jgi:ribonuclease VapC